MEQNKRVYVEANDFQAINKMRDLLDAGEQLRFGCDGDDIIEMRINNPGEYVRRMVEELFIGWPICFPEFNKKGERIFVLESCYGLVEDRIYASKVFYEIE